MSGDAISDPDYEQHPEPQGIHLADHYDENTVTRIRSLHSTYHYFFASKSPAALGNYISHLRDFDRWISKRGIHPEDVQSEDVERWLNLLVEKYPDGTVRNKAMRISHVYGWLSESNISDIDTNPVDNIKISDYATQGGTRQQDELNEDTKYAPSPAKVDQIIRNVPDPQIRNETLLRMLYSTGARQRELSDLKLRHLDQSKQIIRIQNAKKDHHNRPLRYSDRTQELLDYWLAERDEYSTANESDYLFLTRKRPQMRPGYINKIVKSAAENAGIQQVLYQDQNGNDRYLITGHSLRHAFAHHMLATDVDDRDLSINVGDQAIDFSTLADIMGHHDTSVTYQYYSGTDEDQRLRRQRRYGPR